MADAGRVREIGEPAMRRTASTLLVLGLIACESSEPARSPPRYAPYYSPPGPGPLGGPAPAPANLADRRPEDISRGVNASTPRFTDCYLKSESFMLGKSGTVTVFFDIAPAGQVTRATGAAPPGVVVPGAPLADAKLVECLSQGMFAVRFDPARDATAASWTFQFSP